MNSTLAEEAVVLDEDAVEIMDEPPAPRGLDRGAKQRLVRAIMRDVSAPAASETAAAPSTETTTASEAVVAPVDALLQERLRRAEAESDRLRADSEAMQTMVCDIERNREALAREVQELRVTCDRRTEALSMSDARAQALEVGLRKAGEERVQLACQLSDARQQAEAAEARHQAELAEARSRAQAAEARAAEKPEAPLLDRELLALRELVHKKESEALELREQLDANQRQELDHQHALLAIERGGNELKERVLGLERQLLEANERAEREAEQLRAEHNEAQARLRKASAAEVQQLRTDLTRGAERRRERELAAQAEEHRLKLEQHAAALTEELAARHQAELDEQREAAGAQMQEMEREHAAAIGEIEESHRDLKAGMKQRHVAEMQELKDRVAAETASVHEELRQRTEEVATAGARIGVLEADVKDALAALVGLEGKLQQANTERTAHKQSVAARDAQLAALEADRAAQAERVAELEAEVLHRRDEAQALAARLRESGALAEQARQALAAAAALING
jgi:hypothetical protein